MNRTDMWTDEELSFVKENFGKMSYSEIGKKIGRTRNAVMVKMNRLGYKYEEKYTYNKRFFDKIDTEEKAYWLGFIYGDGYISGKYETGIQLKYSDIEHLKKFRKAINANMPISKIERKNFRNPDEYLYISEIRIYGKEMVSDILKTGMSYRKSLTVEFPQLNEKFIRFFVRGYFDANGSVNIDSKANLMRCKITSGSLNFIKSIEKIFIDLDIQYYISKESNDSLAYRIAITNKKSNKVFLEYLYDNANVYLDRKFEFYQKNKDLLIYKNNKSPYS